MIAMHDRSTHVNPVVREYHDNNGTLPAFSSVGGYPIYYLDKCNDVLCAKCAQAIINAKIGDMTLRGLQCDTDSDEIYDSVISTMLNEVSWEASRDWPIASDVHWEGEPLTCEECQAEIESAYGNPDDETEVIEDAPLMMSGYAFEALTNPWESCVNDDWEIGVYTATGHEKHIGTRVIDGSLCNVWDCLDGTVRAQVKIG